MEMVRGGWGLDSVGECNKVMSHLEICWEVIKEWNSQVLMNIIKSLRDERLQLKG